MKLFDIDWSDFLKRVPTWRRLSLCTRQRLAKLKPNQGARLDEFGDDLRRLIDSRFLTLYTDGRRARLHKDSYSFAKAVRAMCRHDVLTRSDMNSFVDYLREHFTNEERAGLCPDKHGYYYDRDGILARSAMSASWLTDFLAVRNIKQARAWEAKREPASYWRCRSDPPLFDKAKALAAAQTVIKQFMSWPDPVPFSDLPDRFQGLPLPQLGKAIFAGMRYLLLFPTMRLDDMTPILTLWPTIPRRLHRPAPNPPATVTPDQTFCGAFLMEDMTTALIAAASEPLRLRGSDYQVFAKARKQLESDLMSLPEWVAGIEGCSTGARLEAALDFLRKLDLVRTEGTRGCDLRIEPTTRAEPWLGMSGKDRLKSILDRLKSSRSQPGGRRPSPETMHFDDDYEPEFERAVLSLGDDDEDYEVSLESYGSAARPAFAPQSMNWRITGARDLDLISALAKAFGALPGDQFVPLAEFVDCRMQCDNPLIERRLKAGPLTLRIGWSSREPTEEEMEELWGDSLIGFLRHRLLPLGGARIGVTGQDQTVCIALTGVGRYMFDLAEDFTYGDGSERHCQVVVQPNFDVVFLAPGPLAEAAIARFAERRGRGTGTLFGITRKSIFKAASTGATADKVLDTLREVSTKAVPHNVKHEVKNWFDQCRRITTRTAILIRCPDAQTAARVIAVGGRKITPITDTVLELADSDFQTTLMRRLKEVGVFIDLPQRSPARW